jgi:23S rRNA (adenine2503-C2)-methyltransferase
MGKINLKGMSIGELSRFLAGRGLPAYRAGQILKWIYEKRAESIDEITVFSKNLRAELGKAAYISNHKPLERLLSRDGTEKFLFGLDDGETVETVLIPDDGRLTLCVSSQAGCAMGCVFCRTGMDGLRRNLKAHEIVDQVISSGRLVFPRRITNIVFMGMGEPLRNVDEVCESLWRITGLMNISKRRITLSTSGVVPAMSSLPGTAPLVNLAVSLNAATDEVRDRIMPINRKYPLKDLLTACRKYPVGKRRRITFEYVMMAGVNDSIDDARRLVQLLGGIPSKVNLIPLNRFDGCGFEPSPEDRILAFQEVLMQAGLTALIRKSKGQDILASCGQLRRARAVTV